MSDGEAEQPLRSKAAYEDSKFKVGDGASSGAVTSSAQALWAARSRPPETAMCGFPPLDPEVEAGNPGRVFRPFVWPAAGRPDIAACPAPSRTLGSSGLPLVILVAWGADADQARFAARDGVDYAQIFNYKIHESLTSHGGRMRDAPLVNIALANFVRRHVDYDLAWWLVPQSAMPPRSGEEQPLQLGALPDSGGG
ncbi:hypothetical protein [Yinghuangia sp. YIM S10712]|uniref:hypothetical protein n=1 Tax=Yinghuangia sp. YIM S10712 TaxID=3436930 RepID=UPI003F5322AB